MKKINKKAFTLIETIVVVAIIGILVLLGTPRLIGYTQRAELARIQHDTKVMENEMGILMLENEVNIRNWENNNKDFNQLIAEDKLFEKEGVAEKVYTEHLTHNGVLDLNKYFREITSSSRTASLSDEELGIGGESYPVNELPEDFSIDKTYKVIPEEYSKKIKTRLGGTFYVNSDGKVYYEHEKPIPGEDKDKTLTCPTALPDYNFEHITGTIVKWHGTEQYLTIPSHFLVDGECWPVRIIGVGAFANGDFKKVVIPDTVVKIENDAFKDAVIGEIVIPPSVVDIADGALSGGRIDKVEVVGEPGRFEPGVFEDTEPIFRRPTPEDVGIVIHPESGTIVSGTRAPSSNSNNSQSGNTGSGNTGSVGGTLIIPEQVEIPGRNEPVRIETIHKGAFQGAGLIEVYLPYTLRRIEAYAFAGNQLNWVEIPTSVEYIGEYAFAFNQHIHSDNKKVRPTIKSIKIKDIERIHNVTLGDIVDGSGNLVNPLDGVEMKEYIWVTDADNFKFEEIEEPGTPEEPSEPGTPEEPSEPEYDIGDAIDVSSMTILEQIGKNDNYPLDGDYVLTSDVDLSSHENWIPIGEVAKPFSGTFYGNGYKIYNLKINNTEKTATGLFGYVDNGAIIDDVALENVDIRGNNKVGGLAGSVAGASKVTNSYTTGKVRGKIDVGGLVGYVSGSTIETSYSTSSLENSTATNGGSGNVGGLIGKASYSRISNSYSTGKSTGYSIIGAFIGDVYYADIVNSYSIGEVYGAAGGDFGAGFTGFTQNNNYSTASNSYYMHGLSGFRSIGTKKTDELMKQQITFNNWDFDTIWTIKDGASYPTLINNPEDIGSNPGQIEGNDGDNGGNDGNTGGNDDSPREPIAGEIPIDSVAKLSKIGQPGESKYPLDGNYILTANINLSEIKDWTPIGNNDSRFVGSFNGNGYNITGLTINKITVNHIGLFGYTDKATIKNVALENIDVRGGWSVGGLVGMAVNGTEISNSYTTGSVTGRSTNSGNIGGLVGSTSTSTKISNSYSTVLVKGQRYVGGLVGAAQNSIISKSYATGSVTGTENHVGGLVGHAGMSTNINNSYATGPVKVSGDYAGGLVGRADSITISNSYATGLVTGSRYLGGLVSEARTSTITTSYWDRGTTGRAASDGGIGMTTDEMKNAGTYSAWGTDVWNIVNGKYPTLK